MSPIFGWAASRRLFLRAELFFNITRCSIALIRCIRFPYDDLYGSMSLFAWLLGITYLGLETLHRQRSVGGHRDVLAGSRGSRLLAFSRLRAVPVSPPARGASFALHVPLNTWAYAAFARSFVLSVIYLIQDRLLRSRRLGAAFWRFPALDVLDRMARSSVYVGLAALLVGVGIGLDLGAPP